MKCRPPDNRDPQPDEVEACRPYLERQMELLNSKVIVTLGRHSFLRFYPNGKISKDHGKILRWNDRVLFPLYHPWSFEIFPFESAQGADCIPEGRTPCLVMARRSPAS